jgi:hypothetical protein
MGGSACYSKTYLPDLKVERGERGRDRERERELHKNWGTCWIAGWPLSLQPVIFIVLMHDHLSGS